MKEDDKGKEEGGGDGCSGVEVEGEGDEKEKLATPQYDSGPTRTNGSEANSTFYTFAPFQGESTDSLHHCSCRLTD